MDDTVAYADDPEVPRRYAKVIADTWDQAASVDALLQDGHAGSRLGILALYEFCKVQAPLPDGADRVAARLRRRPVRLSCPTKGLVTFTHVGPSNGAVT